VLHIHLTGGEGASELRVYYVIPASELAVTSCSASGHPMTNLEYHLRDEPDALRIEIVGDLSGAGVGGDAASESTHAANFIRTVSGLS
jgi:hypothetical protein